MDEEKHIQLNKIEKLRILIAPGEDSSRQFKADIRSAEGLAAEMAAFANGEGGTIFIGVADDGNSPGDYR